MRRGRALRLVATVASSDELTSLPSRAAWDERLPQELNRARREEWQLSVALFTLDDLGEMRSSQGDDTADRLLREAAFAFAQQLRGTDLLAYYDDGVFAAAFPGCTLGPATQLAESMRAVIEGWQRGCRRRIAGTESSRRMT